ncbi:hypothetical protein D3C81_1803760 [compost metagenome]
MKIRAEAPDVKLLAQKPEALIVKALVVKAPAIQGDKARIIAAAGIARGILDAIIKAAGDSRAVKDKADVVAAEIRVDEEAVRIC